MLSNSYQRQVVEAIKEVESHTDAVVIAVMAQKADNYLYISTLWAAFLALLLSPLLQFLPWWINFQQAFMIQWIFFIALAILFHWRRITMKLVPRKIKYWSASNLARRQFLEQELYSTRNQLGLLIFVCEAEHYVEILADRGLAKQITNENWQTIVETFIREIKRGKAGEALLQCIALCGELLHDAAPASKVKDGLPNHLILLS
ncbi:TPM domain-containing protein [Microbulbifer sp. 2205BS26-8]|uniref:TPM domain-containing protein n=1 Tax=Microbulbifer sp. 2205BS26-8 TaxID=3064386 RepID=UPI00273EE28E|nr:hypothetical protein [Microbulbifer sp. 2205BS26-8]MDP5210645.1 hypothetical protein [Microbulbifer sp. 2205BS26-8]